MNAHEGGSGFCGQQISQELRTAGDLQRLAVGVGELRQHGPDSGARDRYTVTRGKESGEFRLATALLDAVAAPVEELDRAYAQHWEHEL